MITESRPKRREYDKVLGAHSRFRHTCFGKISTERSEQKNGPKRPGHKLAQSEIFFLSAKSGSQESSEPSFDIASGGDELILQIHLRVSFVAGAP